MVYVETTVPPPTALTPRSLRLYLNLNAQLEEWVHETSVIEGQEDNWCLPTVMPGEMQGAHRILSSSPPSKGQAISPGQS